MNEDLRLIFEWLCANRLSLNVSKTEFIIFKPPKKSLKERFTLKLNRTVLFESTKIKCLGVIVDDRLTWKYHIFELRKKISKSTGIIYKMSKLCTQKVLLTLYYSLVYSHLSYGISIWGSAEDKLIEKLRIAQKRVIRIVNNSDHVAPSSPIFSKFNILPFDDLYLQQFGCLMWDQDHGNLPSCFDTYFKQVREVHQLGTRMIGKNKLYECLKYNTKTYGQKMFRIQGPKVLNRLKNLKFYKEAKTKFYFRKKQSFVKPRIP